MKNKKKIFFQELQKLFENNIVSSSLEYEIAKIEENFGEYCLTIRCGDLEIKGVFSKIEEKLIEKQNIICNFYLEKSYEQIKIYTKYLYKNKQNKVNQVNQVPNLEIKYTYNFMPEFLQTTLNDLELFEEYLNDENIFIYENLPNNNIIKLFNPIEYEYYYIDYKYIKDISNINNNEFIYLKYHLIDEDNIMCNNLTFIQKANEFQIFSIFDKNISDKNLKEFQEIKEIENNKIINLGYLYAKVILKSIEESYILLIDKFNRIIKLKYGEIKESYKELNLDFDLFDLLIIINCQITKMKTISFIIY